ncbi:MAG: hypothetical protein ACPGO5_01585 [Patescibacteria group bacterium]
MRKHIHTNQDGTLLIIVVVMTGIFVFMLSGYLSLMTYQQRLTNAKIAGIQSLHIAEAGVNYYRWHLAHDPDDYTDGTGGPGPYVHDYYDPTTGLIGQYSLEIDPPEPGSTIVTIRSTGWVNDYPDIERTVEVTYGKPSLAKYSFLTNSDVWLGDSESVSGEMHSNGGVRMDGTNDSLVTSALATYTCTPSHGCSYETKDGVWGTGPNSDLWSFPVTEVDFATITLDLADIKTEAETNGDYYPDSSYGYHITFLADGTYNIYTVTSLQSSLYQIDDDDFSGCESKSEGIASETFIGNYPIPTNSTIFVEDDLWIDGVLNGKITVAAARFPANPSTYANIYINNNLTYVARDNTNALGLVAQKNIQVPRHAPSDLTIDAILLAQNGRVYRAYYCWWPHRLVTNSIEVYGGIITNKIWTWTWVSGSTTVDGYDSTNSIFHNNLLFAPPPYFPTSGEYQFITWEEIPTP